MKRITLLAVIGFGLVSIFLSGCDNATSPADETREDIVSLIQAEDSLFTVDALGDMQDDSLFIHRPRHGRPGFGGPFFPRFIRRVIDNANRSIDVEVITDDSALVTISHQIAGTMFIGMNTDTSNSTRVDTVWEKPFDITSTNEVIVVHREFTDNEMTRMRHRHNGWRIEKMTPIVSAAANTDLTVNEFRVQSVTTDTTFQVSDPLGFYFNWGSNTPLTGQDSVIAEVDLTNEDNSSAVVLAQFFGGPYVGKQVFRLFDDGVSPDVQADDGTYTGSWKVTSDGLRYFMGYNGMNHFMLDIIDDDLLTEPNVPYNAVFWQFPLMMFPHTRFGPNS